VGKADWQVVLVLGSGIAVSYYGREASKGRLLLSMLAVTAQKHFAEPTSLFGVFHRNRLPKLFSRGAT
jgi:hypothetical protein